VLDGLRPARRGEVEVEVQFDISADGIVGVSARDLQTGQRHSITVTATSGLTEDELRHILDEHVDEALERKQVVSEFERRREVAEAAMREIEALVPAVTEALARSRFGKDAVEKAVGVIRRVKQAVAARDVAALQANEEQLDRTLQLFKSLAAGARPPEEQS
jgi:molecular chaperone DnaK